MATRSTPDNEPSRQRPRRDPGDAWVVLPSGERFWGKFGAAGLVAHDPSRGVLLQHRADWSHHGGTWGIPGGAINEGELPVPAALRESAEEAAVPAHSIRVRGTRILDRHVWTYTTVIGQVVRPFEPQVGDAESVALRWVPIEEVDSLALHPGFAQSWPVVRSLLESPPVVIVVDAANVVGSVPDGWWTDRRGATRRLIARIQELATHGLPGTALGIDAASWQVHVDVVVEGAARESASTVPPGTDVQPTDPPSDGPVSVINAQASGDDAIVARVRERSATGNQVWVVTSDRELRERVTAPSPEAASPVEVRGTRWLLDLLPPAQPTDRS